MSDPDPASSTQTLSPRQRTAQLVSTIAWVGIVLTVVATVVAFAMVGRLERSIRDSLTVTAQAIDTVDRSVGVSQDTIDTLSQALDGIGQSTSTIHGSLTSSKGTLDTLQTLLDTSLPTSIEAMQQVLPTIEDAARAMDTALRELSRLPIGPDYNPQVSFDQAIQQLSTAITALPADMRSLAGDVGTLRDSTAALETTVSTFETTITDLQQNLDDARAALSDYVATAAQARAIAERGKHDVGTDTWITRILTVVIGAVLVIVQGLALWIVRHLTVLEETPPPVTVVPE
jgi:septal ring factor EnvC (AmiA/AmiB activator)